MEDEMIKRITDTTSTYVEDHMLPIRVEMSSVEGSPVCTIRFGISFTLNSVTPVDLMDLARELEAFARQAQDFHYPEETDDDDEGGLVALADEFYSALIDENMKNDEAHQRRGVAARSKTLTPDPQSRVELLMQGTVSAPQTDPMNDPMNW
jgi:hypothetical protein